MLVGGYLNLEDLTRGVDGFLGPAGTVGGFLGPAGAAGGFLGPASLGQRWGWWLWDSFCAGGWGSICGEAHNGRDSWALEISHAGSLVYMQ